MAEYIEREAVVKRMGVTPLLQYGIPKEVRDGVIDLVKIQPAADVAPVVHGRWVHDGRRIDGGIDWFHCSACGRSESGVYAFKPYCPNCGAKMDGGADDAAD